MPEELFDTAAGVTAHSGVAKTTIYRRHRDRRAMLSAELSCSTCLWPTARA